MTSAALIKGYVNLVDEKLTDFIGSNQFTSNLLVTSTSKYISELILVFSVVLLTYESIYWGGIKLGLWEYHAKDIFTEIPVHCAHVYVKVNVVKKPNEKKMLEYYDLKQQSKYNVFNWKQLNKLKKSAFERKDFVKYHFEFSPEDFEKNPNPEFGSTVDHLRSKVIDIFNESTLYNEFKSPFLTKGNVVIFNRHSEKIGRDVDYEYLVNCDIETGNVIDCIIRC